MVVYPKRETDVWEVRCIYRHSDIPKRIQQGLLKGKEIRKYPPKKGPGKGGFTVITQWIDPVNNEQVAETCHYLMPGGKIGASGELDPKMVINNGMLVVAYQGNERAKRDLGSVMPSAPFGRSWIPRLYGWYRKRCCKKLGPDGDAALALKRTPQILKAMSAFGLCAA